MKTSEIVELSEAIAARKTVAELEVAGPVIEDRGLERSVEPVDPRHARIEVEIDPRDPAGQRVKGLRVHLGTPEAARWDQLESRWGPFVPVAEMLDAPEHLPVQVGRVAPRQGALAQTIRISLDSQKRVTGFVVREVFD